MFHLRYVLWIMGFFLGFAAQAAEPILLMTGPKTGTYYAIGRDIAAFAHSRNILVDFKSSEGSVDNITQLPKFPAPTLAIVQSDVLGFLGRSQGEAAKDIVSHIRVAFPLYKEEVHVLARKDIPSFADLQGKRVAVGEEGSGHMLTAVNLLAIEQVTPAVMQKISPEAGVVAVLNGELDAVIFVGGKPVKLFKNMESFTRPEYQKFSLLLQNVHFLSLNDSRFYEEYEPTEITPQDYSFVKSIVPTISVQAVLVAYDKNAADKVISDVRCQWIQAFSTMLHDGLPALKQAGHPKWQEVDLAGDVLGFQKHTCLEQASE